MEKDETPEHRLKKFKFHFVVGVAALTVAVLISTALMDPRALISYVSAADAPMYHSRIKKVAGRVLEGSIAGTQADTAVTFTLVDEYGDTLRVYYDRLRPDAFRDGAQAVVEGSYRPASGLFVASHMLAKCPSKYAVDTGTQKPDTR